MKTKPKRNKPKYSDEPEILPPGMQRTREVPIEQVTRAEDRDTYSKRATGSAPHDQAEQGNRQADETAELEQVEPDLEDRYRSPR